MESRMEGPQKKIKTRNTLWCSNSTSRYISKRIKNICPYRNLYMNVHNRIVHNNQKVEKKQISLNWWWNKQIMVYVYSRMLFSPKKEQNIGTCYTKDEHFLHYIKCRKPDTKTAYCMIPPIWHDQNSQIYRAESISVIARDWGERGNEGWLLIGIGFLFVVIKMFWN